MSQVVAHLLGKFPLLIPEVACSRRSQSAGCAQAAPRACSSRRAWFRFLSRTRAACTASSILPTHLGTAFTSLEEGAADLLVLHSGDARHPRASQPTGGTAHGLRSHVVWLEVEAQREVGVGGPQLHAEQAVARGLHLGGIILTDLGAPG